MPHLDSKLEPKPLGRNEKCHCGSGKKYKRCCGVGAAPRLTSPKANNSQAAFKGGFDPEALRSQMDPKLLEELASSFSRLPKSQLQKFQHLMQKELAGEDVSAEAVKLEKTLPPQMAELLRSMASAPEPSTAGELPAQESLETEMTPEQARALVLKAVTEGQVSEEEANKLLK